MLPGISGFHWSFGHIVFVSIFLTVLATVGITVLLAMRRSARDVARARVDHIRWHGEFAELTSAERACRHQITGEAADRTCANEFDCRACKDHVKFVRPAVPAQDEWYGLSYPSRRFYHRGHTWVEPQEDGTLLVGLDEIGHRLIGRPDAAELPAVGARVTTHGPGWRMAKDGIDVRVLSPVDGEVVATGGPGEGWYLRVKPPVMDLRHLLHGAEVGAWVRRELDRLMRLVRPEGAAESYADGGELIHGVMSAQPDAKWDAIAGAVFLEP